MKKITRFMLFLNFFAFSLHAAETSPQDFSNLPDEMWLTILSYVEDNKHDLRFVSTRWNRFISAHGLFLFIKDENIHEFIQRNRKKISFTFAVSSLCLKLKHADKACISEAFEFLHDDDEMSSSWRNNIHQLAVSQPHLSQQIISVAHVKQILSLPKLTTLVLEDTPIELNDTVDFATCKLANFAFPGKNYDVFIAALSCPTLIRLCVTNLYEPLLAKPILPKFPQTLEYLNLEGRLPTNMSKAIKELNSLTALKLTFGDRIFVIDKDFVDALKNKPLRELNLNNSFSVEDDSFLPLVVGQFSKVGITFAAFHHIDAENSNESTLTIELSQPTWCEKTMQALNASRHEKGDATLVSVTAQQMKLYMTEFFANNDDKILEASLDEFDTHYAFTLKWKKKPVDAEQDAPNLIARGSPIAMHLPKNANIDYRVEHDIDVILNLTELYDSVVTLTITSDYMDTFKESHVALLNNFKKLRSLNCLARDRVIVEEAALAALNSSHDFTITIGDDRKSIHIIRVLHNDK